MSLASEDRTLIREGIRAQQQTNRLLAEVVEALKALVAQLPK